MRPDGLSPTGVTPGRGRARSPGTAGLPAYPYDLARRVEEEYELGDASVYLAWELVRCVPDLDATDERSLIALVLATLVSHHQGSTCLPLDGPGASHFDDLLTRLAGPGGPLAARRLLGDTRLAPILGQPHEYKPLILDGARLYHQRMLHFEGRLVEALARRLSRPPLGRHEADVAAALAAVLADSPLIGKMPIVLSPEQQYAVLCAVYSPLAIITGGPGTGKTSIVVSILRVLTRLGVPIESVALAAPTGKAANRIEESIQKSIATLSSHDPRDEAIRNGAKGRTVHRLLGYRPTADRFAHHENNRLSEKVIIVDECSMIDLFLMDRLLRSMRDDAQLVLLGDAEQLPSVDAGAVFRDLIPAGESAAWMPWRSLVQPAAAARPLGLPITAAPDDARWRAAFRLGHSYRMDLGKPEGRNILDVAKTINDGCAAGLLAAGDQALGTQQVVRRAAPAELTFKGVELLLDQDGQQLEPFLAHWFDTRIVAVPDFSRLVTATYVHGRNGFHEADFAALDELFRHYESHRILCITRGDRWPTGAESVNLRLHEMLRRKIKPEGKPRPAAEIDPGEPIQMQRNDYDRGLFNGDQGLVLWVAAEGQTAQPAAVFRRGQREFTAFQLAALAGDIKRCFAMTVHKGQGSEFDHVALVLPGRDMALLTREILYTAVTRSRTSVIIVGDEGLFAKGVEKRIVRFSGVADRLAAQRKVPG